MRKQHQIHHYPILSNQISSPHARKLNPFKNPSNHISTYYSFMRSSYGHKLLIYMRNIIIFYLPYDRLMVIKLHYVIGNMIEIDI